LGKRGGPSFKSTETSGRKKKAARRNFRKDLLLKSSTGAPGREGSLGKGVSKSVRNPAGGSYPSLHSRGGRRRSGSLTKKVAEGTKVPTWTLASKKIGTVIFFLHQEGLKGRKDEGKAQGRKKGHKTEKGGKSTITIGKKANRATNDVFLDRKKSRGRKKLQKERVSQSLGTDGNRWSDTPFFDHKEKKVPQRKRHGGREKKIHSEGAGRRNWLHQNLGKAYL